MAYTTIDDPSAFFQTALWTGDGSTSDRSITNDGNSDLKPDLILGACRSNTQAKMFTDSSRGFSVGNKEVSWNGAAAEGDTGAVNTGAYGWLGPSLTDGFTSNYGSVNNGYWNVSSRTYVAWQWKNNDGTTASNSDGSITSSVQVNATAGFSIVTYTGTGSAATIGHGLGVVPEMIWVKCRNEGSTNWTIYHKNSNATPQNYILEFNNTNAAVDNDRFNDTAPTSSVFSVNAGSSTVNKSSNTYVAYCFNSVQGYSKFGSYVGNGTSGTDGTFIYTGFKPAMVMTKRATSADAWVIYDNKRDPRSPCEIAIAANGASNVDDTFANWDFVSNGFKSITGNSQGANGVTFIYWAFAESPFVSSKGIPTTARAITG